MEDNFLTSLRGHFIVAVPDMLDPNFSDSVTFICDHTEASAMGLVINRALDQLTLKDVYEELGVPVNPGVADTPVYMGGPVQTQYIFILHGAPFNWEGCVKITEDIGLTNTPDVLHAIAEEKGPEHFIVALGAAGWSAGQLESEIMASVWLTHPVDRDVVFHVPAKDRWKKIMDNMGVDPAMLSSLSGKA